ncbi:hypothetical protein K432DRAFT_260382, partial [Lepidopterella palustris CBS 459.81]
KQDAPRRLNVLLTNGRFPVTLDLARQLHRAGHRIYTVDPMEYHVCKFSNSVKSSKQLSAPRVDADGYINGVKRALKQWNIDLIIPLHEEIFYLAECGDEEIQSKLLAPSWSTLIRLHNKWEFNKMMQRFGLTIPETHLILTESDIQSLDRTKEWAVKPVLGRAAVNVYHIYPNRPIPAIPITPAMSYIAQEWINGARYCSYSVLRNGHIAAHGAYPVLETIDGSSCVYFESYDHPGIQTFVEKIAAELPSVSAQLAFDFIETEDNLYVIECNPRATSGIHLWSGTPYLARSLTSETPPLETIRPPTTWLGHPAKRQVGPGMMMWEHRRAGVRQWLMHMWRLVSATDVVWNVHDAMPSLMSPFLLTAYYEICRERKLQLPEMFQWDVVWEPDEVKMEQVNIFCDEE